MRPLLQGSHHPGLFVHTTTTSSPSRAVLSAHTMIDAVSIIVPVFNRHSAIGDALQSLVRQTYHHWEAIVVDDCSTDGTSRVVEEYTRKDARFRLLSHAERKGAQAARNSGIRAAQGRWIAFLDSDDQWVPDSLASRLRVMEEKGFDVVHSDCYVIGPNATELRRYGIPPMEGQIYTELLRRPGPLFQGLVVSKEALNRIRCLDENIASFQEWDTAIQLAKCHEFAFLPEPTFIYNCLRNDSISSDLARTALGYQQVVVKHRWAILRHAGPRALAGHYETTARHYFRANDVPSALRFFLLAALLWPFQPAAYFRRVQQFLAATRRGHTRCA